MTNLAADLRAMGTSDVVPDMEKMDALLIKSADEIEQLRELLRESYVWAASLAGIYRHRGNVMMANQVDAYVLKLQQMLPRESSRTEEGSPATVLPIGSPTDQNKIHTYSIDSRPRIVPLESDRITAVWVSDGKLCLVIQPQHARVDPFHPCGPDYTSPDGKWMAPQLLESINEARKKLGLSNFTVEDSWNMGERNVRLMYYALTDRLPDESVAESRL